MGTSMAFYNIINRGFTRDELADKLSCLPERPFMLFDTDAMFTREVERMFEVFKFPEDQYDIKIDFVHELQQTHDRLKNEDRDNNLTGHSNPIIAFNKEAKMLPLFKPHLCEGNNATTTETDLMSEHFGAPVLAFSIYDSDVLFISYSDKAAGVAYNYAMPNYEEFEDYDFEYFSREFPEFLLSFCDESDHQKLRDIWAKMDYIFADDRMFDICELIGANIIYGAEHNLEGFDTIHGNKA